MPIKIGYVQSMSRSDVSGWGFTLQDSTANPARFMTLMYPIQAQAEAARQQITVATAYAIDAFIAD